MKAKRADRLLKAAVDFHQAGRLADAEPLYRSVLDLVPKTHLALHNLGLIALATGRVDEAVRLLQRAAARNPAYAAGQGNLALALDRAGRTDEAVACLRQAIGLAPGEARHHFNLGNLLKAAGRADEAAASYRRAIAIDGSDGEAYANLGAALSDGGHADEAIEACRQALRLAPGLVDAHVNLGTALRTAGRAEEAEACYRRALDLAPTDRVARVDLAKALIDLGRFDDALVEGRTVLAAAPGYAPAHETMGVALTKRGALDEALRCFDQALALDPRNHLAHVGRGAALALLDRADEAIEATRRALAIKPDESVAWSNLGALYTREGRHWEAIQAWNKAITLSPESWQAVFSLGMAFLEVGANDKAAICFRRAVALDDRRSEVFAALGGTLGLLGDPAEAAKAFDQCERLDPGRHAVNSLFFRKGGADWSGFDDYTASIFDQIHRGDDALSPFMLLGVSCNSAEQKSNGERWAERVGQGVVAVTRPEREGPQELGRRLRVGYLSGDFHDHPVMNLAVEVFERHDRGGFEVVGYSYGPPDDGAMRRRLSAAFERFEDVRPLSYRAAAEKIRDDGIDILVDLSGYTRYGRPQIAAHRPAPVQVSYLGFPGTMGAPWLDYVVADAYLVPFAQQPFYAERIVHLPVSYQPSDTTRRVAPVTRAACGLPELGVVLVGFNNSYKITPDVFSVWMRVLQAVPGSVLWLLAMTPGAEANLRREAEARGVGADRLVFASRVGMEEYLGRLAVADLFLDCHPYTAGATANDALWAGLPIVTCVGETYVSRMAGSLLHALGMDDLIASSLAEYEALATGLAGDRARLAAVRARLAAAKESSALFDMAAYTRALETAFRTMWDRHAVGLPPQPFAVPS